MSKKQLTFYILISKSLYDVGVFLFCEATKGTAIKTDIGVRPGSVHLFWTARTQMHITAVLKTTREASQVLHGKLALKIRFRLTFQLEYLRRDIPHQSIVK